MFREVDIKGAVSPEKVVDKSTREALTRWISCRGLTTSVAESHSILVRRLLTMIYTGIGQRCNSDSSVPETTGLNGCLLHGIKRLRVNEVRLACCIKVSFVMIVPVTAVNPHIRTGKNRSMLPTASNCIGRPSNFLKAL